MRSPTDYTRIYLILAETIVAILVFLTPLSLLEYLSGEVVGEPPITGETWIKTDYSIIGEFSMKLLAIIGLIIIVHTFYFVLKIQNAPLPERNVSRLELISFIVIALIFCGVNYLIGYNYWNPNAFLGMGLLFIPWILSYLILGLIPFIFKVIFNFKSEDFAASTTHLFSYLFTVSFIAFGYGLFSGIWHCCAFRGAIEYILFITIKFIQFFCICLYFFMYGFNLLLSKIKKPWIAYIIISFFFALLNTLHTLSYSITYFCFGIILCILVRKTDSFLPAFFFLYLSYIFHAGLPWRGAVETITIIYPISILILIIIVYANIRLRI